MAAKKNGRPSKFDQLTDLEKANLERMAKKGFTDAEMAEFIGVTEQTLNNWKKAKPKFFESLKDWKAEADHKVERSLYERATGFICKEDKIFNNNGKEMIVPTEKHYPPDTTACIFWLKNRDKENWRDKVDLGGGLDICKKDMTDKEVDEALIKKAELLGIDISKLVEESEK